MLKSPVGRMDAFERLKNKWRHSAGAARRGCGRVAALAYSRERSHTRSQSSDTFSKFREGTRVHQHRQHLSLGQKSNEQKADMSEFSRKR